MPSPDRVALPLLVVAPLFLACHAETPTHEPEPVPVASTPPEPVTPPEPPLTQKLSRWVPSDAFREVGGGVRAAVVGGRRITITGAEASVLDRQPIEDLGRAHRIPASLGGGWLFVGETHVRVATSFDAAPKLVASATRGPLRVGVGRGQVLVDGPHVPPSLYSLADQQKVPAPVPGIRQLFGTPGGVVAAVDDKGQLWVSVNAGTPFRELSPGPVEHLGYDGKGIVVESRGGAQRIGPKGTLSQRPDEPGLTVSDNVDAFQEPWPDLSKHPPTRSPIDRLVEPLVVAMDAKSALAVEGHALRVLDASTGKLVGEQASAFAGHENCFPIRGGSPAFVDCNDPSTMTLFHVDSTNANPTLERSFKGVYSQDFGEPADDAPLALAKRCDGSAAPGVVCVRAADGKWSETAKPADPGKLLARVPFVVHVAASPDGEAYAFGWLDGNGPLVIVDAGAKKVRSIERAKLPDWAAEGIRWDALSIRGTTLRFLISGNAPGVLEIEKDDTVHARRLQGRMASTGARALLVADDGSVQETLDSGATFSEVTAPPGGAPKTGLFRCVATGCSLGAWTRVGWGPE
jgi:hypothetical protein